MSQAGASLLIPAGRAYDAAKLRWATSNDIARLLELFSRARPEEPEIQGQMTEWLESGGAALLEDDLGSALCAVRWRETGGGWRLDRVCTLPEARRLGFGRWLMTKVEALAIRYNIPVLTVALPSAEMAGYYRRLGYVLEETDEGLVARKRVGGTWQMKALER